MVKKSGQLRREMTTRLRALGYTNEEIQAAFPPAGVKEQKTAEELEITKQLDEAIATVQKLYE